MLFYLLIRRKDSPYFDGYGYKIGKYKYITEDRLNEIALDMLDDIEDSQWFKFKFMF